MSNTQPGTLDHGVYDTWHNKILEAVSDNMKTATALVLMQDMLKDATVNPTTKLALFEFIDRLLGLQFIDRAKKLHNVENIAIPAEIQALADVRQAAKAARDYAKADEIRAQLDNAGWSIVDTRDGAKIVKKA